MQLDRFTQKAQEAVRTEQGLLFVRGGQIAFYDRRTLYNI